MRKQIKAVFLENEFGLYGFEVSNHGNPIVCAAVTALAINAVNSIETLTETGLEYEHEPEQKGGFIRCIATDLRDGEDEDSALLLLKSFELGITKIADQYPKDLVIERK